MLGGGASRIQHSGWWAVPSPASAVSVVESTVAAVDSRKKLCAPYWFPVLV